MHGTDLEAAVALATAVAVAARQVWRCAVAITTLTRNVEQLAERLDRHVSNHGPGRHAL